MRILLLCLFSGLAQAGEFHVCTVASYKHENLEKLNLSCKKHNIELEVLGLDKPYYGNGTKLFRLGHYVNTLPDDDIVMFVDAFDVLVVADKEIILDKFLAMDTPFVMSGEKNCFPFPELAVHFDDAPAPFKYINSGGLIGYASHLKAWIKSLHPIVLREGDQGQVTKKYLNNRSVFKIDHQCELFLSLFTVQEDEIAIDERGVHCLPTGSQPCVVHANGNSFHFWNIIYETLICH